MPGPCSPSERDAALAWASSGAMALSGRADGPALGPPARLVGALEATGARVTAVTAALGSPVELSWLALLGERAAILGLERRGTTSCGGATRLLPVVDGWLAVSLARRDDVDLLPAWLGVEPASTEAETWERVAAALHERPSAELVAGAALLGLPVSALGERTPSVTAGICPTQIGDARPRPALEDVRVLDLSSLWAGPLCASILGLAGATVVKLESTTRPDGARRGPAGFFDLLNAGKRSVAVDLRSQAGRGALASLVASADVVVEASRPRALEQLGVVAADVLAGRAGPRVWLSLTGHGRSVPRVAFGDDAAVAGGLVVDDGSGPCFCADAVADPLSGVAAAAAALEALAQGGRWSIDVAMAGVAAAHAGPTLAAAGEAAPPRARHPSGTARPLGADTAAVLAEL